MVTEVPGVPESVLSPEIDSVLTMNGSVVLGTPFRISWTTLGADPEAPDGVPTRAMI